jgi:hypothetical protein
MQWAGSYYVPVLSPEPINITLYSEWVSTYMEKDVISLRILTGGVYLVLSEWALNPITNVLIRPGQREITKKKRQCDSGERD